MFGKFKKKGESRGPPKPPQPSNDTKPQAILGAAVLGYNKSAPPAKVTKSTSTLSTTSKVLSSSNNSTNKNNHNKTASNILRQAGGKTWVDPSLAEWDPSHFRLFVGNLSPEVTDSMLTGAFDQFASLQKAKVIIDKKTSKAKGFGFVAFSDPDEYFRAFKEMNGKYVGNHPIQLKRANTDLTKKQK